MKQESPAEGGGNDVIDLVHPTEITKESLQALDGTKLPLPSLECVVNAMELSSPRGMSPREESKEQREERERKEKWWKGVYDNIMPGQKVKIICNGVRVEVERFIETETVTLRAEISDERSELYGVYTLETSYAYPSMIHLNYIFHFSKPEYWTRRDIHHAMGLKVPDLVYRMNDDQ